MNGKNRTDPAVVFDSVETRKREVGDVCAHTAVRMQMQYKSDRYFYYYIFCLCPLFSCFSFFIFFFLILPVSTL